MALDTRNRRASALACGLAFLTVLPAPDGLTLDQGDRQQVAALYRGILAVPAVPPVVLNICDTSVMSLLSDRTVGSLVDAYTVESILPDRTVEGTCT